MKDGEAAREGGGAGGGGGADAPDTGAMADTVILDAAHCQEARASIERIERLLRHSPGLPPAIRDELAAATEELEHALEPLYEGSAAHARSVTHFAEAAAHEASKVEPDRGLIDIALEGLNRAVRPVEAKEPRLVRIAGRLAQALADLGI